MRSKVRLIGIYKIPNSVEPFVFTHKAVPVTACNGELTISCLMGSFF
jgi:hypothetical protein